MFIFCRTGVWVGLVCVYYLSDQFLSVGCQTFVAVEQEKTRTLFANDFPSCVQVSNDRKKQP